jgi:SAM-dependent methyltransferase
MTRRLIVKAVGTVAREGVLGTARKAWQFFAATVLYGRRRRRQREALEQEDGFDATHGTDTSSLVPVGSLDLPDEHRAYAVLYWPSLQRTVERLLGSLPIDHPGFTFVDVGSGKGRVLLMASLFPFRRIIGVELSERLHEVAERNVGVFHPAEQRCRDIELVHGDASQFAFPEQDLVLYFFDPFDRTVMERVVSNLAESLRRHPREVWVIYLHARCRAVFDESPLFELVSESRQVGPRYAAIEYDRCVYRHRRAASAPSSPS